MDVWVLDEECTYDDQGMLNGRFIIYDITTEKPLSVHNYVKNEEVGIQQDFYHSGKLHSKYEKDHTGSFINEYVVYYENGQTLFNVNFEIEGTGYLKFYQRGNRVEWEGNYINKKKEGWHKNYLIGYGGKIIEEEKILYKNDSIIDVVVIEHK
jgi:antitoxin component YwqK of YwqJK toxin-antitoxin module